MWKVIHKMWTTSKNGGQLLKIAKKVLTQHIWGKILFVTI